MPPKKGESKKTLQKEKAKILEDKTFGLKNKNKSSKVQKFIKSVETTVDSAQKRKEAAVARQTQPKKDKEAEEQYKQELATLFRPIQQTKVPAGVDPKSVLCEYFKAGLCTKGVKCKFSHDPNVSRKAEKIDLYTDQREVGTDTMENWTQAELEEVVSKREDICKFFLDAVESKKYGWFWICPNGADKCQYRHALPPGFVLKTKEKEKDADDDDDEVTIEEQIEEERKLLTSRTPVTLQTFLEWKKRKTDEKDRKKKEQEAKDVADKKRHIMSGRDLFSFNPDLFVDDDEGMGGDELERDEEDVPIFDINVDGTSISLTRATRDVVLEVKLLTPQETPDSSGNAGEDGTGDVDGVNADLFLAEDVDDIEIEDIDDGDDEEEDVGDGDN